MDYLIYSKIDSESDRLLTLFDNQADQITVVRDEIDLLREMALLLPSLVILYELAPKYKKWVYRVMEDSFVYRDIAVLCIDSNPDEESLHYEVSTTSSSAELLLSAERAMKLIQKNELSVEKPVKGEVAGYIHSFNEILVRVDAPCMLHGGKEIDIKGVFFDKTDSADTRKRSIRSLGIFNNYYRNELTFVGCDEITMKKLRKQQKKIV